MTAPRLTTRVVLEERVASPDGAGGEGDHWTAVGVHFIALLARSAAEGQTGLREHGAVSYRATLRHAPHGSAARPRPDQRFREGERIFNILGVADADDRKQWLTCWLEEGAPS
ncbi:MAG: head-tail adaptor protein [Pikeienuella sp.]